MLLMPRLQDAQVTEACARINSEEHNGNEA